MKKDVTIVTTEIHVKLAWSVCSLDVVPSNMNKEISQIASETYVELERSVAGRELEGLLPMTLAWGVKNGDTLECFLRAGGGNCECCGQ
jgi:hypothetical protein